jgi:nitroreductase
MTHTTPDPRPAAAPEIPTGVEAPSEVEAAIGQRRSVRAFKPDPVPREIVERILKLSARAPSGTNMQPWRAHVVTGAAKDRLSAAVLKAFDDPDVEGKGEYSYYPKQFPEPFLARRRKVGWDLYGLLGIEKGDKDRMHAQHGRNYTFFDAPVGIVFTIDRRLEIGSWLDYGMFLQNVMILARAHGLESCPQAAFAPYHQPIRETLGLEDGEVVVCGLSLGYADWTAPENTLITERAPLEDWVSFRDA